MVKENNKTVVYSDPKYTSRKCPECGFIEKNRKGHFIALIVVLNFILI
jgi:transposase